MSRAFSRLFFKYSSTPVISSNTVPLTPYLPTSMTANKRDVDVKSVTSTVHNHNANMDHQTILSAFPTSSTRQDNTPPVVGGDIDPNTSFPTVKKPRKRKKAASGEVPHMPASQFFQPTPPDSSSLSIRPKNQQTSRHQLSVQSKQDYSTYSAPLTRSQRAALKNGPPAAETNDYIPLDAHQPQPQQAGEGQMIGAFFNSQAPQAPPPNEATARKQKKRTAKRDAKDQQESSTIKQPPSAKTPKATPRGGRYGDMKRNVLLKPIPGPSYMANISHGYQIHLTSHPLLVILDLNGVLVHRRKGSKTGYVPRLDLEPFLDYLFANHHVMIWSSGMPANVTQICQRVLSPAQYEALVAIWARDSLRLSTEAFSQNVQVYKQLSWVWGNQELQGKAGAGTAFGASAVGTYAQRNTVLIDDSEEKALAEPWNLLKVDEFMGGEEVAEGEKGVLMRVVEYLEQLKWASDASAYMRQHPFDAGKSEPHP